MAGGTARGGDDRLTMAERLAQTRATEARHTQGIEPHTAASPPDVKHAWYAGPDGRQAALLLGWRKATTHSAWEGHIAVARPVDDGWGLVLLWVSAGMLEPCRTADADT